MGDQVAPLAHSAQTAETTDLSGQELAELVDLLRALIRIPSVNPPGDEILDARQIH